MSLEALKLENRVNNFLLRCKEVFPDDIYISKFNADEFVDSSVWDLEYLPKDIRKMNIKRKIFNYINNYINNYKLTSFDTIFKKFKRYANCNKSNEVSELEVNFINEVNSSVLSDICTNMSLYGCNHSEALLMAEIENNKNLELAKLKLNITKRNFDICKKLEMNIEFKIKE